MMTDSELTPEQKEEIARRVQRHRDNLEKKAARGELHLGPPRTRVPAGVSEEDAPRYRELRDKRRALRDQRKDLLGAIKKLEAQMRQLGGLRR